MSKLTLESLPIYPTLPEIYKFISTNVKGAILGSTGIGKSIGIPAYLAKANSKLRYYMAVPNLGIAKSLVYSQKRLSPDVPIAFASDLHPPPDNSRIIYATSDYIKDLFFESVRLKNTVNTFADVLFIDEAHVTNIDNYIIIELWEYLYKIKSDIKVPRLYLLTTTLDQSVYSTFEIFNTKIKAFPITIKYTSTDYTVNSNKRNEDIASLIISQHQVLPRDIIFMAFMSGKKDINSLIAALRRRFSERNLTDFNIVSAHGDLTTEENRRIYESTIGRKIIITTNLFESSITIPGHIVVFDSMLEKRRNTNNEIGNFITHYISKVSANHRAGRSGRLFEGTVFRMCTLEKFNELEEFKPLDVYSVPIYSILVKLILTEVEEILSILPKEVLAKAPAAIRLMRNLGIINELNNITDLGMFYYKSKLSIREACLVWWWLKTNSTNYYSGVIVALIINNYSDTYFYYNQEEIDTTPEGIPYSDTEKRINRDKYKVKHFNKFRGDSDLHTYMNAWLNLIIELKSNPNLDVRKQIAEWCVANAFKFKKIYSVYEMSKRLILLINKEGLLTEGKPVETHIYSTNDVIYQMMPILKSVYYDKMFIAVKDKEYFVKPNENDRYFLERDQTVNTFFERPPKQLISFNEFVLPERRVYKINFALNLELNDTRVFNYNVIDIKQRIPKRAHPPTFEAVVTTTYIRYPAINIDMNFRLPFNPEKPLEGLIPIGLIFPYRN